MTRRERKKARKEVRRGTAGAIRPAPSSPSTASLKPVKPITINQSRIVRDFQRGYHLLVYGYAGTGKSYLGLWMALHEIENQDSDGPSKIEIIRSTVPSRDQGFLPGGPEEKAEVYEQPYREIVDSLYGKSGTYNRLKDTKVIRFSSTSYLRGLTIDNAYIIVDEVQNMTDAEINTVMTRVGPNSRVILLGDFRQNDLALKRQESGIYRLMDTIGKMESFSSIEMQPEDIVRSGLVREWILARG